MSLKHVLLCRQRRPTALVALFHGLGDNCTTLRPVAERWLAALPSVAFLLLEAPDRDYFARELLSGAWSGDWYREQRPRAAGETAEQSPGAVPFGILKQKPKPIIGGHRQ